MDTLVRHARAVLFFISVAGIGLHQKASAAADPATVRIRAVQGEGAVYATGTRAPDVIVEVTDENGEPVRGAAVSFRLPASGPAGTFPNGLTTDVVLTDSVGIAKAPRIRWNNIAGPVEIRITAAKGTARAGILMNARLSGNEKDVEAQQDLAALGSRRKWLKVTAVIAGVAAGSAFAGLALVKRETTAQTSTSAATLAVGPPVITIGAPR